MAWTRNLTPPIVLKDGRVLETLSDVREVMLSLPERHLQNGHWVYAGQLLMAAATDKGVSMHEVQQQLSIALKAEGLTQNGPAAGAWGRSQCASRPKGGPQWARGKPRAFEDRTRYAAESSGSFAPFIKL
jgi:hypothetical protein